MQPSTTTVAALVLNWRDPARTISCVRSLRNQVGLSETIVVDNESQPTSRDVLARELPSDTTLLHVDENRGFGAGLNVAIAHLRKRHIPPTHLLLVNNDLVLEVGAVEKLVAKLQSDRSVGIVSPVIYDFPIGQTAKVQTAGGRIKPLRGTVAQASDPGDGRIDYVSFACALIRFDTMVSVNGFDESFFMYWEDVDLCLRAKKAGWGVKIVADAAAWHELSASAGVAGTKLLTYGVWAARVFASGERGVWPYTVRMRAVGSAILRLAKRRPNDARALWAGLFFPINPSVPGYEQLVTDSRRLSGDRGRPSNAKRPAP